MKQSPKASRKLIAFMSLLVLTLVLALYFVLFLARQSSATHYNLYYLMWKTGFREYESAIALPGMFHDLGFRDSLKGTSLKEFEDRFPSTFYELKTLPPNADPAQRYFISDYAKAQREDGRFDLVWFAVFKDEKLVELGFSKS